MPQLPYLKLISKLGQSSTYHKGIELLLSSQPLELCQGRLLLQAFAQCFGSFGSNLEELQGAARAVYVSYYLVLLYSCTECELTSSTPTWLTQSLQHMKLQREAKKHL